MNIMNLRFLTTNEVHKWWKQEKTCGERNPSLIHGRAHEYWLLNGFEGSRRRRISPGSAPATGSQLLLDLSQLALRVRLWAEENGKDFQEVSEDSVGRRRSLDITGWRLDTTGWRLDTTRFLVKFP